jgi:methylmalonyl-CoA/ethylmalonyl-CoA epimerase
MREPVFTETLQVAIVVRDLDAAMRTYVHDYGVGRWDIYEFNRGNVKDLREYGQPVERSWRLAVAMVGQVMWELIEPLDEEGIYARLLAEKGEGVHHIGVAAPRFDDAVAAQAERGNGVVLSGEFSGVRVAYLRHPPSPARSSGGARSSTARTSPNDWPGPIGGLSRQNEHAPP